MRRVGSGIGSKAAPDRDKATDKVAASSSQPLDRVLLVMIAVKGWGKRQENEKKETRARHPRATAADQQHPTPPGR